jgi:cytochrome oxidase Cu insertion factor (SCO1/SenC/PrrC family)
MAPQPATRMGWLAAAYLDLVVAPAAAHDERRPSTPPRELGLARSPKLPDFPLLDTEGRPVRLSAQRGRVVLLSFIYTRCTTACPLLTQQLALLQARLLRADRHSCEVRLLSVTVDPARDSAATLPGSTSSTAVGASARSTAWRSSTSARPSWTFRPCSGSRGSDASAVGPSRLSRGAC